MASRRLALTSNTSLIATTSCQFYCYNIANTAPRALSNLAAVVGSRVRWGGVARRREPHAAAAAARPDPVRHVTGGGSGNRGPLGKTAAEVGGQVSEAGRMLPEATGRAGDGRKDNARWWWRRLLAAVRQMRW